MAKEKPEEVNFEITDENVEIKSEEDNTVIVTFDKGASYTGMLNGDSVTIEVADHTFILPSKLGEILKAKK